MKLRLATPSVLIDVGRARRPVVHHATPATTSPSARSPATATSRRPTCCRPQVPILAHAAGQVGDPQVRHRGTIGGSIAHADPASRPAGGRARARRHAGRHGPSSGERDDRGVATSSPGFLESALEPDELLTEIRVPEGARARAGRSRSSTGARRTGRSSAWPRCEATARRASALVNMGSTPVRASAVEQALAGGASAADAAEHAAEGHRAAGRPQRQHRVPRAPRPGARRAAPSSKPAADPTRTLRG